MPLGCDWGWGGGPHGDEVFSEAHRVSAQGWHVKGISWVWLPCGPAARRADSPSMLQTPTQQSLEVWSVSCPLTPSSCWGLKAR